ncbi:hypothetical protein [Streptomyces griseorubiginosus]|uniref:hypothetical protein n=1 Tax=Streptomyces griseorubiginosus TaxID=67304 RepID=UPI001AD7C909|nr:hypothetical protein [Streptomyces griseorubiginosus]MBO4254908.1 hypothetical protein [Streptomyces griseorubiginosus]
MPQTWIALDSSARRRNWWWTGYLTVIFAGLAITLTAIGKKFTWVIVVTFFWLLSVTYMINRACGRTLLASDGIQFHTFFSRRMIPWSEVADVEKRRHQGRSAEWWELRVVRRRGRSLGVPGAFTSRSYDDTFENKLVLIREYWARSVDAE